MGISRTVSKIKSEAERAAFYARALDEAASAFRALHGGRPKVTPGKYGGTCASRWFRDNTRIVAKVVSGDAGDADWIWVELQIKLPDDDDARIAVLAEASLSEQPTAAAWTQAIARAVTRAARRLNEREKAIRAIWGTGRIDALMSEIPGHDLASRGSR